MEPNEVTAIETNDGEWELRDEALDRPTPAKSCLPTATLWCKRDPTT